MNSQDIVKQILENNYYMVLATADGEKPWANAAFFAHDKNYNLYFTSYNDSRHVQNILKNPQVSVVIFDSHIIPGTGAQGIQIEATCQRVIGKDLLYAIEVVYTKRFPDPKEREGHDLSVEHFSLPDSINNSTDHIYKITPKHIYILEKNSEKKDKRLEVKY